MLRQAHRRMYLFAFVTLAACSICGLSTQRAHAQTFLSFDAPGAGTSDGQGTFPVAINRSGLIVGNFVDASGAQHGFMRATDGTFTTFDPPGSTGTYVTTVNSKGLVVGWYETSTSTFGFLRYLNGTFVTLNAFQGTSYTLPVAMNDIGEIAGDVGFAANVTRGFLSSPTESFKMFRVPDGGSWVGVAALNSSGVIAGAYPDVFKQSTRRGFLRDNAGNFTGFDATDGALDTAATTINTSGQVAGWYVDASDEEFPFLRDADGAITLFTVAGSQGVATSINDLGVVVGYAYSNNSENAFERDAAGNVTALTLPFNSLGSTAASINSSGRVVGIYYDSAYVVHGWLMTP
jgi:hypothetical protein